MTMKRTLALLLAVLMLAAIFAGCGKKEAVDSSGQTAADLQTAGTDTAAEPAQDENGTYTNNMAVSYLPVNWNPHASQDSVGGDVQTYIFMNLYDFDYNDDYSGYVIEPSMAAADPVDVTDQYVGEEWGIEEGETGKAFRISLIKDACWDDGTPINADSYINSMKLLLDPDMMNYRASDYYGSGVCIHNAKNYVYAGKESPLTVREYMDQEGYDDLDAFVADYADVASYIDWNYSFGDTYDAATGEWTGAAEDGVVESGMNLADLYSLYVASAVEMGLTSEDGAREWFLDECSGGYALPAVSFDQVGIQKVDDYTFDLILDKELVGFYIKYNLCTNWLVKEDLYESCKTQDETGTWSSTYCTDVQTTPSTGPYKLTGFTLDQQMVWERNENWWGYTDAYADEYGTFIRGIDGQECRQYMTDKIVWTVASDTSTREEMFLKGQLDNLGLNGDQLSTYSSSDALYFTEGESTYYGVLCSDYSMLLGRENILNGGDADADPASCATPYKYNKTILAIDEFRQALSYSIDRTALCAALYPAGTAAYSLYSNSIMADPENSIPLNDFEAIRAGICDVWGVTYGEGGEFATLDEAYDAITGYNLDEARKLVDEAVDKAIENGWMTEDSIVVIVNGDSSASDTSTKWYNFFKASFEELVKGTKLEGKFQYDSDFTLGNEWFTKIQNGEVDVFWGAGWTGSALNPYELFEVYVDNGSSKDSYYQYDQWVNWCEYDLTMRFDVDGTGEKDYTYNLYQWFEVINGLDNDNEGLPNWGFGKVEDTVRAEVLAKMQTIVLENYTTIPMMNQGSVQLKSYKINFGQEEYIYGLGRGGNRYMTFNYTDAQWSEYCAGQSGGILTY